MKKSIVVLVSTAALAANGYGQALGSLVINTLAVSGLHGDGGPATAAQLISPVSVALDQAGNLYIADSAIVRKVASDGTITGDGLAGFSGDRGPATAARLGGLLALAVDAGGSVFIADTSNHRIHQVTPDGVIDTIVGSGHAKFYGR